MVGAGGPSLRPGRERLRHLRSEARNQSEQSDLRVRQDRVRPAVAQNGDAVRLGDGNDEPPAKAAADLERAVALGAAPALGEPFRRALQDGAPNGALDRGCVQGYGAFEIPDLSQRSDAVVSEPQVALITFLPTLLRRLQALGSPPAIDYTAYERWMAGQTATPIQN